MSTNVFLQDPSFYQRDLDPIRQYVDQTGFYLSKMRGIDPIAAKELVRNGIKGKRFPNLQDPSVQFYERHNYEDREITHLPLSKYLAGIQSENLVMAPSLTCYVSASEKESILSGFTDNNVKQRNVSKKEAARQKALGNKDKAAHFTNEQENKKLCNNALSGAYSSAGSIVRNPSAHSSLTSTTRTLTSIGNASNERLISGNRHYRNPEITLNNLVLLAKNADAEGIARACSRFGIRYPTVEETMECVQYSSNLYWRDVQRTEAIRRFICRLSDVERASIVYTGDLRHLRTLNPESIRTFIWKLSRKVVGQTVENPIQVLQTADELYINFVHQVCMDEVRGIGKDYTRISVEKQNTVAATLLNLRAVLTEYQDLIKAFFLTKSMPASVAYIRDSIRRTVVLSDTDSTMFSCDEWVLWYFGRLEWSPEAYAVAGSIMFMATQCIAHNLALYSANLNVERRKLFTAAMKPEYVFSVFALTSAGKHYFTNILAKEGSVYAESELEIKGVHLKSSASPKNIVKDARAMMQSILATVGSGNKISIRDCVRHVADIEREIQRSVYAGETTYLGRLNIKSPEAYKGNAEESNYRHHLFWNEVFAPLYGPAPSPTYTTVKFPTTLHSKKFLGSWIDRIEDPGLQSRLREYLLRTGRSDLNTIYVSQDLIDAYGVPKEIKAAINVQGLVMEHSKSHRLILGSLGFYCKEDQTLTQMGY